MPTRGSNAQKIAKITKNCYEEKPRKIIKESTHSWTAGNHPAHETIVVEGYERYWSNSTKTGHEIDIVRQDGSTISIKMKWPKGYNPRLYEVNHRGKG